MKTLWVSGSEPVSISHSQGMYRTAQWIKNQIYNRQSGEGLVQSVCESKIKKEATNGNSGESSLTENKQILRATMEKYWVHTYNVHTNHWSLSF